MRPRLCSACLDSLAGARLVGREEGYLTYLDRAVDLARIDRLAIEACTCGHRDRLVMATPAHLTRRPGALALLRRGH